MKERLKKRGWKAKAVVFVSIAVTGMALLFSWAFRNQVVASEPDRTVSLGTGRIAAPSLPEEGKAWNGDYVYFGTYEDEPVRWRVLDTSGDAGSSSAAGGFLLQSDRILETMPFEDGEDHAGQHGNGALPANQWSVSDIRAWLRGNDAFLSGDHFSKREKEAIMRTTAAKGESPEESLQSVALNKDTVFLLDVSDLANERYGYSCEDGIVNGKWDRAWWLRSAYTKSGSGAGCILSGGQVFRDFVIERNGVVPALNLDPSGILFITGAGMAKGEPLAPVEAKEISEWKLTMSEGQTLEAGTAERHANEITVPYTYTGEDANQISVMIMNGEYQKDTTAVTYYGKVSEGAFAAEGTVTFTLPEGLDEDDARVYLLAEQVNAGNRTDYASEPVEIELPPAHVHQWEWRYDEEAHWHVCTAPDCDLEAVEDVEDNVDYEEHDFGENEGVIIKEPTEEEDGIEQILCDICGNLIQVPVAFEGPDEPEETDEPDGPDEPDEPDEPHEHEFVEVVIKAATCTETGIKRRYCEDEDCQESYEEEIPALSATRTHTFGQWTQVTAATTAKEGVAKRTCTVCGATQTGAIPKLVPAHTHTYQETWVTNEVNHWFQCECGEKEDLEPHEWNRGKVLKKPAKKREGEIQYRCTVCGRTINRVIPKVGTKFVCGSYQYKVAGCRNGYPVATLLGFARGKRSKVVNVPDTVTAKGVTYSVIKVADKAFASDSRIQKVVVGNKVELVGNYAFFLAGNIESITLGTGVKEVGEHAFCHTEKLKLLVIKSKKLEETMTGILHGSAVNVLIKVPAAKVKQYQEEVFDTHPQCVKALKNE